MADTPDLSKLVGLIMQNPELISQISALAKSESTQNIVADTDGSEVVSESSASESRSESESTSTSGSIRSHRQELLHAMKPYLSEQRRAAIDSMISISEIIDMVRKK